MPALLLGLGLPCNFPVDDRRWNERFIAGRHIRFPPQYNLQVIGSG
jgi:hypothetical protein